MKSVTQKCSGRTQPKLEAQPESQPVLMIHKPPIASSEAIRQESSPLKMIDELQPEPFVDQEIRPNYNPNSAKLRGPVVEMGPSAVGRFAFFDYDQSAELDQRSSFRDQRSDNADLENGRHFWVVDDPRWRRSCASCL